MRSATLLAMRTDSIQHGRAAPIPRLSSAWRHEMPIENLARHASRFVTVAELAAYWLVSPQQIRRHIEAGELDAIRLGPRLYRIAVEDALRFEQRITRIVRTQQIVRPIRRSRS